MRRGTKPTPVPLPGFLNLSAASQQTRVSRPCFMPQPFLGFSLQSLPLAEIAHPSRGHIAPLWSSTRVLDAASWTLSPPVSPTPTLSRGCLVPHVDYGLPFHAPKHASRPPWVQTTELARSASFTHFEALILLRVRSHSPGSPRANTPLLSWGSASLEPSPSTPRVLDPPEPRGPARAPSSGDSAHGPEDLTPPRPGETVPTHECPETISSTASDPLRAGPHRLSAASATPLALEPRAETRRP
jgi:hypothetical protein